MKKFTSVFLTAILIISLFSFNAFAQEQTRAEKWIQNNKNRSPEYEIFIYSEIGNNQSITQVYIKDGKVSLLSDLPLSENESIKLKVIISDGYMYMFHPSVPFLHIKHEVTEENFPDLYYNVLEDIVLTDSTEITEGQTTYYIEEYTNSEGATLKYYFIGDELLKMETSGVDENGFDVFTSTKMISYEVDDSVFEIPWYSIDVTPLVTFFADMMVY